VSFLAAVPYYLIHAAESAAGIDPGDPAAVNLNLYLCTLLVCGICGAAIPAAFYTLVRRDLATALILAFATPLCAFSTVMFAHVPSALFILIAFALSFGEKKRGAVAGFFAGLAALTNYLAVPLFLLFAAITAIRKRGLIPFLLAAAPSIALLAWYQRIAFGGWFRTPIETMDERFATAGAFYRIFRGFSLDALYGITFSPYRGLFYVSPVLLLVFVGAWLRFRTKEERFQSAVAAAIPVYFFLFNTTFNGWEGGFAIGPRYLLPAIPIAALFLPDGLRAAKRIAPVLVIIAFANNFAATAVDAQPSATIPRPLDQYIYPLLLTGTFADDVPITPPWSTETLDGHVAVNPQTADQAIPFMFYPPHSEPSLWASFNLGEFFLGRGSVLSVLPIALWILGGSWWLFRSDRREGGLETRPYITRSSP
jgi:hypothetical protein